MHMDASTLEQLHESLERALQGCCSMWNGSTNA
jgi:hypothetical protein